MLNSEVKTVSVWFQNKRQTEKKAGRWSVSLSSSSEQSSLKRGSSPSKNTSIGKRARPPHYTDKYHNVASRHKPPFLVNDESTSISSVSYETESDIPRTSAKPEKGLDDITIPPHELWKHLLSSPPTPSEDFPDSYSDLDPGARSACIPVNNFTNNQNFTAEGSSKRARMLDWVCDRQAKRRRNNRGEPNDSIELMTTDDICTNCLQSRCPDFETIISLLALPGNSGPSEDVIRAASLLLCFKYSAQNPQKTGYTYA